MAMFIFNVTGITGLHGKEKRKKQEYYTIAQNLVNTIFAE